MGSLIFTVEDEIQNMKLTFIFLLAFLFAAVSALPRKKGKNMKWHDESDEMEEDEIFQMDVAVDTVDNQPQAENAMSNEMEQEKTVDSGSQIEGKGYGYRGRRATGKKGKKGKKGKYGDDYYNYDDEYEYVKEEEVTIDNNYYNNYY